MNYLNDTLFDFRIDDDCKLFLEITLLHLLEINKLEKKILKNQEEFGMATVYPKINDETGTMEFYSIFKKTVDEIK